jgi:hypothetical protein
MGSAGAKPTPEYDGIVYACDHSELRLKSMTWDEYLDQCEALDENGAATSDAKAKLQEILSQEGYDGLIIRDCRRRETVIFPGSLHKIRLEPIDGYHYKQNT